MSLLIFFALPTADALSQSRDLHAERVVIDDNATDGARHTMTLQTPGGGLSANRTLTFPDGDGTVMTGPSSVTASQILFGGSGGQVAQSSNLLWNDGAGLFNIGAGNFTVAAASGNTSIGGTLNIVGAISNAGGSVTVDDALVVTAGNTADFRGPITSTSGNLTINDAVTLNSDGGAGTDLTILETGIQRNSGVDETLTFDNTGAGDLDLIVFGDFAITGKAISASTVSADPGVTLVTKDYLTAGNLAVQTDATLTGDGTTGNALGIDLANANSWTAAQTFSSVDVNGGNIDATTIGAFSPAAGTFTSVTTSGGTVTVNDGANADLVITEGGFDRNSVGTEVIRLNNSGTGDVDVLINGAAQTSNSRLTVNGGHWTSQGTAPTAVGAATNLNPTVAVSANSTDVAGSVTATDGGAIGAGVITVTFADAYAGTPYVVVTAANSDAANTPYYVSNVTTTGFNITVSTTLGDNTTTYAFNYHVIEGN